ncbi:MAG: hypothetical protein Q4B32_01265 [Clostridia bacterium]|nr:hypothetical protein [Clostridia bacterium]
MDLQKVIKQVLDALNNNDALVKEFLADPAKVLESKLGIDLPNEQVNAVVEGVKAKLNLDNAASVLNAVQGLFGKK